MARIAPSIPLQRVCVCVAAAVYLTENWREKKEKIILKKEYFKVFFFSFYSLPVMVYKKLLDAIGKNTE